MNSVQFQHARPLFQQAQAEFSRTVNAFFRLKGSAHNNIGYHVRNSGILTQSDSLLDHVGGCFLVVGFEGLEIPGLHTNLQGGKASLHHAGQQFGMLQDGAGVRLGKPAEIPLLTIGDKGIAKLPHPACIERERIVRKQHHPNLRVGLQLLP